MIVYRGPREAFGGGVRNWGGACAGVPALAPNSTKNKPVCSARVLRLPCCPGSPLPETTSARASPGPVMRAWDGPFASAGVASMIAAAMLMAAARAVTTVSLRSIGRLLPPAAHFCYTAARCRVPASASPRRPRDGKRGCLAEVAFQPQRHLPGGPDQCVAGGEPGGGHGGCAVAGDVHQVVRALDPQALGAVDLDPGHFAQLNELLEIGLVQVAGEFIH